MIRRKRIPRMLYSITGILLFALTMLVVLSISAAALEKLPVLTREEFDLWPELPEYTIFNPFPGKGGNCTWYAHGRMMQLGYSKYALDSMRFNANTWAGAADRGAYVTDSPQVGSIAFWDSYQFYGSALGHVGVVEEVKENGSILISDSSSSGSAYRTFSVSPGDSRWPTSFIVVPEGPEKSLLFSPGTMVRTTAYSLNFRQEGINQPSLLLPKDSLIIIKDHVSNGIYASRPGSTSSYYYWWYGTTEFEGEIRHGWVAEEYLEASGFNEPAPSPAPNPTPVPVYIYGDVSGDGTIDVRDVALIMQYNLNLTLLDNDQKIAADVNGDGKIDVRDVALIMRYALGLIEALAD
ncbi:MAG: CHAP domain-containing protein [Bacillota bacterium]|nr:CHAP domain-containing protein [Bacillota bacterium]